MKEVTTRTLFLLVLSTYLLSGCTTDSAPIRNSEENAISETTLEPNRIKPDPPEIKLKDFAELGFAFDNNALDVEPDHATRRVWPNGYLLESATWRGRSGYPRIMINVLDVTESGESFTAVSELVKPMQQRISDLLPGEDIEILNKGKFKNNYGRSDFQMFDIDARLKCAFIKQFLTRNAASTTVTNHRNFGQIVIEAIVCDQESANIDKKYVERISRAYRIGKTGN